MATVVVFGAGVQGTIYGAMLARAGHQVTMVARGARAEALRKNGAVISQAATGEIQAAVVTVIEGLADDISADICLVTVRREQLADALLSLRAAYGLRRIVIMVNHGCGSGLVYDALGRERTVLALRNSKKKACAHNWNL